MMSHRKSWSRFWRGFGTILGVYVRNMRSKHSVTQTFITSEWFDMSYRLKASTKWTRRHALCWLSRSPTLLLGLLTIGALNLFAATDKRAEAALAGKFDTVIRPFLDSYCLGCHDSLTKKGDFDLSPYKTMSAVTRDYLRWELALDRLEAGEMPPEKAKKKPAAALRKEVIDWIHAVRKFEADRNAGDPGMVVARRLNNSEYNNSIRDLTGVDIKPTREFPVDPANQAGFDNTGESLTMSPALLKKYYQAAREVSEHAVLDLDGINFATHPMMVHTDRDKYCILRIVDFYRRQPTDYADYFAAAWKFQHRAALGKSRASLADIAAESEISAKYLATIWETLNAKAEVGPISRIQAMWRELPAPMRGHPVPDLRKDCEAIGNFISDVREKIKPVVKNLNAPGLNPSAQALAIWKDRALAANHRKYDPEQLQIDGVLKPQPEPANNGRNSGRRNMVKKEREADPNLNVPFAEREKYEAAFARFAATFPDAFYIKERARVFLDPEEEKASGNVGRLLSAGLHNQTGYFRDDQPLYDLVLDGKGQRELDHLWDEFFVIASVPQRMHESTLYFERTDSRFLSAEEFDFARAEDKDCSSEAKVKRLAELYYAKAVRSGASEAALAAIKEHFERRWQEIDRTVKMARASEPKHIEALAAFAEKAYRRPLQQWERDALLKFYRTSREQDKLTHDEAIRDTLASVLMSPYFLYRVDLAPEGKEIHPLSDYALASRLSYFLWSTMPDAELLRLASAGELHRPRTLSAQADRMLKDSRARSLATEFLGNWLDFRRFEEHNAVDRGRFPQFDNELRAAMFEEPVQFFQDVLKENRPVLDFLYAKRTFVNPALAKLYEIPNISGSSNTWTRVDDATPYQRGGLLPMAVFLTKNAPGLRTSPVKRGYWVVRRVLGERIPPPPPVVPELPNDETKLGELTLRETLAKHRENVACAGCHARFDSYGLVFEGFGPIGERRIKDFGGKLVDTKAPFPDGTEQSGIEGLRNFLKGNRENDFIDTLCRQLLAFGLGRTLILSDDSTLREMKARLVSNNYRFNTLVETIVTSPQFLNKRDQVDLIHN